MGCEVCGQHEGLEHLKLPQRAFRASRMATSFQFWDRVACKLEVWAGV